MAIKHALPYTRRDIIHIILATLLCSLGISLCTKSNVGLSMIAAVPYILHLALRDLLPWFTQGTAEYFWEAVLLIITCIAVRRFHLRYLLSFLAAVLSGLTIDGWLWLLGGNGPWATLPGRLLSFAAGMCLGGIAVALFFRTKVPLLQVYELFVTEISDKFGLVNTTVKFFFDVGMFVLAVILALALTGGFHGASVGTLVIALLNAPLIKFFGGIIDRIEGTAK